MGQEIQKVRYTHDAMIDLIIADPSIHQNHLAKIFGYTASFVSIICCSDSFKERLAMRKAELSDPIILASVRERFEALTVRSLEVLQEQLSAPAAAINPDVALKAAALGAKAMGIGGFSAKVEAAPIAPAADRLDVLASRLLGLMGGRGASVSDAVVVGGDRDEPRNAVGSGGVAVEAAG